jgi:hypothetical protein
VAKFREAAEYSSERAARPDNLEQVEDELYLQQWRCGELYVALPTAFVTKKKLLC